MSDKNLSAAKKSRRGGSRVIAVVILVVCVLVLAAVNLKTLTIEWNFANVGGALVSSTPYTKPGTKQVQGGVIELNGYLYFGGMDGAVYKLDKQGKLVTKREIGSPILASLAAYEGSLIVVDFSGNVTKITL